MQHTALTFALSLLLVAAAHADPKPLTITTKSGRTFFNCTVTRVYPDGVGFTHRDGVIRIAFKDLPDNLKKEYRYDPAKEAAYAKEQAAKRQEEQKRARLHEIMMEEQLAEAKMAEASYLAAATRAPVPLSPDSSSGMTTQVFTTPSWVGSPITGTPMGGSAYSRRLYSGYPLSMGGYGGYYPYYGSGYFPYYGGGYYPSYYSGGYGYYPFGGYGCGSGFGFPSTGIQISPTFFRSWNVGGGFRVGVGVSPFSSVLRVFP